MRRLIAVLVIVVMAVQASACGFLIYPERKGQKSGSIDPGVAILDAAGLLVFLVPGLIAFGVDFVTGCIYVPGGRRAAVDGEPLRIVYLDPGNMEPDAIELAVERATGVEIDLADPAVRTVAVVDLAAFQARVAVAQ